MSRRSKIILTAYWLYVPLLALMIGVLLDIYLPGLYMDAVNPDYMVVRMLGEAKNSDIWVLPGNLFFGRYPLLSSLYHGTGQAWLGAPIYAILGTDIFSIRLVHGMCGLAVLSSMLIVLRQVGVWPWLISCIGLVVALDPSFVFAFRTQIYITLTPLAALFLSIYFLHRAVNASYPIKFLIGSGCAFGLSIYGYFIYAFFLPVMFAAVWLSTKNRHTSQPPSVANSVLSLEFRKWLMGFCVGILPYLIGYLIIMQRTGGPMGFIEFVQKMTQSLNVFEASNNSLGRFDAIWAYLLNVANHTSLSTFWSDKPLPLYGAKTKAICLVSVPLIFYFFAEWRNTATFWTRLVVALSVSFFLASFMFGARLASHHMIAIYVFLHLVIVITAYDALRRADFQTQKPVLEKWRKVLLATLVIAPLGVAAVQNLHGQLKSRDILRETRGVGLYSDAITLFADDIKKNNKAAYYVMPDWGLLMPSIFLTSGLTEITANENFAHARQLLCRGREVRWVLVSGDRTARFNEITRQLKWSDPTIQSWKQKVSKKFGMETF